MEILEKKFRENARNVRDEDVPVELAQQNKMKNVKICECCVVLVGLTTTILLSAMKVDKIRKYL